MNEAKSEGANEYTATLTGFGGEYACIPITAQQATYWADQGNDALAAHLSLRGQEDQNVPAEYQLPDFREAHFLSGIDPDAGAQLMVEGLGGLCLQLESDDEDFYEKLHFSREVGPIDGRPEEPTVMYRTFLKGSDVYRIRTEKPFDQDALRFDCAEVAQCGDVISSIVYDDGEVEFLSGADREKQEPAAILLWNHS